MADNLAHPYNQRQVLTIDDLPDDDLLAIFDFYVVGYQDLCYRGFLDYNTKRKIESWQSLVHVCRRWRYLVFESPRHLNLKLYYIPSILRKSKSLEVWPALPLLIVGAVSETSSVDNVVAELEHRDRIRQITLRLSTPKTENLWTAMQAPFPELAALNLSMGSLLEGPVLPDSFLGGSAPRLRYFSLSRIPFPGLPELLLSATHLVTLHLCNIPHSGYISPEAMVTCLSTLASLESLQLEFDPQSYTDFKSRRPSPPSLSVLPTLTKFSFKGFNEYLEEFVARIDVPQLYQSWTTFYGLDFNIPETPELNHFISRAPALGACDEAYLAFGDGGAIVRLCPFQPELSGDRMFQVQIFCQVSHQQLSTLAQICTLSLRPLLTIENLYIEDYLDSLDWVDDIENSKWLDLLLPFTAVKNLYLSQQYSPLIAPALQELTGGRTTEVLPALQKVLLEGFWPPEPVHEGIAQFISARQLTNHPVAISTWDRDLVGGRVRSGQ